MATLRIQSAEIEPFWATPKILLFLRMRFFNFFLICMVQKYQNEISPIFYYGKKLKTSEKLLKIPDLRPPDWGQPYWMTRYIVWFWWDCPYIQRYFNDLINSLLIKMSLIFIMRQLMEYCSDSWPSLLLEIFLNMRSIF